MASIQPKAARPLSPHLQIYRMTLTMFMSIMHRLTGVISYGSLAIAAIWLAAAASGREAFDIVNGLLATIPGQIVLFGMTWALLHHLAGGIRHFIWDTGRGFNRPAYEWMARLSLIGALGAAVAFWVYIYHMLGKI